MKAKWKRWIKLARPWKRLKEREQLIDHLRAQLKLQKELSTKQQAALGRKKVALVQLGYKYLQVLDELQHMKCGKIKHVSRKAADKAAARFFNQTSHVMEPYECYVCPKNPDTDSKWWHIRHAVKSERGKHGPAGKDLKTAGA